MKTFARLLLQQVIEELDEQMTITAGGKLERRNEKPHVRTVFPPQPPLPGGSASSNLSNITYTEVMSADGEFGRQNENERKDGVVFVRNDSDSSSNRRTPSTSSLLFVVDPVVDETANKPGTSRTSSVAYDCETSKMTPDNLD